jgi:hypothetical protein
VKHGFVFAVHRCEVANRSRALVRGFVSELSLKFRAVTTEWLAPTRFRF